MSTPRLVTFVTGNAGKLREVQAILPPTGPIKITSEALDLPELQGTTHQVARDKCIRAAEAINGPVLTEDTCLCFNALKGLPGPYIKWFMKSVGHDGLNRMLAGFDDKSAFALCTFAYSAGPGEEPIIFEGRTDGRIVPARGPTTFGWDPIFEPEGFDLTYAELPAETKNGISHRYKALKKVQEHFEKIQGSA
ncbi:inosine triphosphate pyrophosphatase [Blyttiomyces helicus]|uniref:Inosine triphosphate pyrophosphatase n=1 Tax=Blyttiomyces helicus TaxID=388810 RepID=A0A4P9WIX4_9FUNG|nr:inosine triphosphate pyrophosphatase [Blyttiomyces helicus]|eukprot:RKO92851.1 inosine triphosphate pyrophosphatase [Blyttiomyces helicus]